MKLRLKELFEIEGEHKDISCELSFDELDKIGTYSFSGPVRLKGTVCNRAGVVTLEYSCGFTVDHVCDRCVREFQREYEYEFRHILVRNGADDDYLVCDDNTLDLNEVVLSDILLTLPTKILCREDCKGLCMICGADLNETDCGHSAASD